MRSILLGALLLASQIVFAQPSPTASPNETPAGTSSESPKTPEHAAGQHAGEAAGGSTTHPEHSTAAQGAEHAKAAVEHGEGEAEHAMPNEIWWKLANFALLVAGLGYLIKKNAGPFFAARTESIQKGITEAAAMRADAEARAAAIEAKVSSLTADVAALRAKSKEEIAAESARLEAETTKQLAKVQAQAEAEIIAAAKHATATLRAYSAQLAVDLAERQLRDKMTPEIRHDLTESFVNDMKTQAPAGTVQ